MMEPVVVGYIGIGVLVLLLFAGLHIGVVMGLIGFAGMTYLCGWSAGLGVLKTTPYVTFASFDFSIIPLFILMGEFCYHGGLSGDLYQAAYTFFGRLRGGLAASTVGACAAFAAVSASGVATVATMTTVALPEMKKYNYDMGLATGTLAAGGTIGVLIPPSVFMVIYGMLTQQSIGRLFLAGFIPGILQAVLFIGVIMFICWRNPSLGPSGPGTGFIQKIKALKNTWIVLLLFVVVIGGINFGIFSITEGAAVGAIGALFFALIRRRMSWKGFRTSIVSSIKTTGMIFFIMLGAVILSYFLAVTRLPSELSEAVSGLSVSPYIIWFFMVLLYIFLGCIMDEIGMILLTVPIVFPLMCGPGGLGFDPVWFGIMIVMVCEVGMIVPPVGMNVFVIKGMVPDVPTFTIYRGVLPFLYMDLLEVAILTAFPAIVLWLPQLYFFSPS
ncbi:MAG: TRAP transporter large permease [Dehalococcoidales bacterium]|nr:TRAP transporter large permease [Dehalococcoidales bacterium]